MNVRRLIVIASGLLVLGVTAALGFWQLSRAHQKDALHAAARAADRQPVLDGSALSAAPSPFDPSLIDLVGRNIRLTGRWQSNATDYLDNRVMDQRSGFYVLTPLRLQGSRWSLLVMRGWLPRDAEDRTRIPPFATPAGPVEVAGRLLAHPPRTFALGGEGTGPIWQNIELAERVQSSDAPLLGLVLEQHGSASDGLLRAWPDSTHGIASHRGYAAQWFGMSALVAVLLLWFQVLKPFFGRGRHHDR